MSAIILRLIRDVSLILAIVFLTSFLAGYLDGVVEIHERRVATK